MATITLEFMLDYRKRFVEALSRSYPIPTPWLTLYADVWDWEELSRNTALAWDEALLDANFDRWGWRRYGLSSNTALPWSANFIRKYVGLGAWGWLDLQEQPKIFESAEMVELCLPHWSALAGNTPWSADFIEAHADGLDWRQLSCNSNLPWTIDFIRRFEDRWDWDSLCACTEIPWTEAWLDCFAAKLSWARPNEHRDTWGGSVEGLLNHPGIRWTPETFARRRADVEAQFRQLAELHAELELQYWTYHCDTSNWAPELVELLLAFERSGEIDRPTIDWARLCRHAPGLWTPEFLEAHRDRIDWRALSGNDDFAPNTSTLLRHADRWNWPVLSKHARMSVETLLAVVDRLDMEWLANSKHLDRRIVVALREHWTSSAWEYLSSREFVSFFDAEIELPWWWDILILHAPAEQLAQIDQSLIQHFLEVVVKDRQPPARNFELEAVIASDLEQRDNYEVYADWLFERSDPHASLIRAMLETSEPFDIEEFGTTQDYPDADPPAHVSAYERFIEFDPRGVVWHRGFVRAMWGHVEGWERLVGLRAFRFLQALHLDFRLRGVDDAALELLRPLDCLAKLSVLRNQIYKPTALAHLRALTLLRLDHSTLTDLSPLSGLPHLRSLTIRSTQVRDLGPLGEIPNLRRVDVGDGPLTDLSPLRACRSLVELDVSHTAVRDLSPLRQLGSLRRIFLEDTAASEAEIRALREHLPALRVCNREEWWAEVGEVGRFWSPSDC